MHLSCARVYSVSSPCIVYSGVQYINIIGMLPYS
jgi:hypothetical protein